MSDVIQAIISKVSDEQSAEKQQRQQKYQTLLNQAREELRKVFDLVDGLYETLKPYMKEDYDLDQSYGNPIVRLEWEVISDELQLSPILAKITLPRNYDGHFLYVDGCRYEPANIQKAIAYSRASYPEWKEKQNNKFVSARSDKFRFWYQRDREQMQIAYDELVAKFPDRKAEFDQLRQTWEDEKAQFDIQEEEKRKAQTQTKQAQEEYLEKLVRYYRLYDRVLKANEEKAQPIQDALNQPFEAFKLTYGLVGEEDGSAYVDTAFEWVTSETPDENGYWTKFNGKPIKYFHKVSIEKFTVKPIDKISGLYWNHTFSTYGVTFVMAPHLDDDVNEQIDQFGFEPLPKKPDAPEILSWGEIEHVERLAKKEAGVNEPEPETYF